MNITEIKIKSFDDLHKEVEGRGYNLGWVYRGQADANWGLIPKIGRVSYSPAEAKMFLAWQRYAFEYVQNPAGLDSWDWLAIAQHHGLATRLLDWTSNPLAAAFFAVETELSSDAAVYAYKASQKVDTRADTDPLAFAGIAQFQPRRVASRIGRQAGVFTVHGPPGTDLLNTLNPQDMLVKLVIDRSFRRDLRFKLSDLGVNRSTLFPDLDGLSSHLNWVAGNWQEIFRRAK